MSLWRSDVSFDAQCISTVFYWSVNTELTCDTGLNISQVKERSDFAVVNGQAFAFSAKGIHNHM